MIEILRCTVNNKPVEIGIDPRESLADTLREKVESVQETLRGLGAKLERASGFFESVKGVINSVIDFFKNLFA